MPNHGWGGQAPASDDEAIARILDAADDISGRGETLRLTDVARALGVTRQTVYRLFPGTQALVVASAMRAADGLIERLIVRISGQTEPAAVMIESVAFAAETLAGDPQFEAMLRARQQGGASVSLASETAVTFGRSILRRFDIDWERNGFDEDGLDELAELCLRTLHSLLIDPGHPARSGTDLRRFLARWLGPAVIYPRLMQTIDTLPRPLH